MSSLHNMITCGNSITFAHYMKQEVQTIFTEGQVILVDKPLEWTSHDVVAKVRNAIKIKKVGHAGTLDPLATGLLILCTGKFTKRINEYQAREKEYTGTFTIGAVTPTYDLESEPINFKPYDEINAAMIEAAKNKFIGEIMQVPPAHSAIKKDGKRVYELARQGVEVELDARRVTISQFEIVSVNMPVLEFRVVCSTGTYIRSLANDFGKELGCGGYLSSLCRTRIGSFVLEQSWTMEEAEKKMRETVQNG